MKTRPSLSAPRYPLDPAAVEMYRRVIDPGRARQAFATSDFIRRLWPQALLADSLPYFDEQRMMNRVLWEGGKPLPQIDTAVFSLEKESIPYWNKFLQGYYDASGISSDKRSSRSKSGVADAQTRRVSGSPVPSRGLRSR